ncbi:MAG: DNA translocase FtsK 4TM domain-containing protein, partial [Verrucomicrobiae bacterium]|nr:DNA translocase FtsK 4TM domain-containing protein [Verrucomicrobiae bacterium]
MANTKKKVKAAPQSATLASYSGKSRPVVGSFFLVIGVLLLVSLLAFDLDHSRFKSVGFEPVSQTDAGSQQFAVGVFGEYVAFFSLWMFGFAAWVIVFFCFYLSFLNIFKRSHLLRWPKIIAIFAYIFSVSVLGALLQSSFFQDRLETIHNDWSYAQGLGGVVGDVLYTRAMHVWLGPLGTSIVIGATLFVSLWVLLTSDLS